MTVFPMRGAHTGDLILALPAIGAALNWGSVTVSGLAPRYYLPFARLPIVFRHSSPCAQVVNPRRIRGQHQTDLWLAALPARSAPVRLQLPLLDMAAAGSSLPGGSWVILSPWSDFRPKRWIDERWRAVALYVLGLGYKVAVMGPSQAEAICSAIAGKECMSLVGRDTPMTWPSLLARGALVIATDSAPVHVADAIGIPVIGLYGPTCVAEFGPYWRRDLCVSGNAMADITSDSVCTMVRAWHEENLSGSAASSMLGSP